MTCITQLQVCFQGAADRNKEASFPSCCMFLFVPCDRLVGFWWHLSSKPSSCCSVLPPHAKPHIYSFRFSHSSSLSITAGSVLPLTASAMPLFSVLLPKMLVCTNYFNFLHSHPRLSSSPLPPSLLGHLRPDRCSSLQLVAPAHIAQL